MKGNCRGAMFWTIKGHVCKYTSPPPVKAGLLNTKICKRMVPGIWLSFVCYDVTYHFPGNGNPLQYSCLMDRGAWQATVHGVAKSCTQLSDWAESIKLSSCVCVCSMHCNMGNAEDSSLRMVASYSSHSAWETLSTMNGSAPTCLMTSKQLLFLPLPWVQIPMIKYCQTNTSSTVLLGYPR